MIPELRAAELDRNKLTAVEHIGNGEFGEVSDNLCFVLQA
jgi:hypothetical protein